MNYAANLNIGDSFVDFTNSGADNGANICVNLYAFDPAEELIGCCFRLRYTKRTPILVRLAFGD